MQTNDYTQGLQQALAQLPPPVSPQAISNVPAIGWFILAALLTALLVALTVVALKRYSIYKRFRPLHLYLRKLHVNLEKQSGIELDASWSRSVLLDVGKLIRKTCMDLNNSTSTQSLTGTPWLEEADRVAARDKKPLLARHSDSFAKLYDKRTVNKQELAELLHACQQWVSGLQQVALTKPDIWQNQVGNGMSTSRQTRTFINGRIE